MLASLLTLLLGKGADGGDALEGAGGAGGAAAAIDGGAALLEADARARLLLLSVDDEEEGWEPFDSIRNHPGLGDQLLICIPQ